ncbi:MAG: hypothetical protein AB7N71_08670 [Phycisphaerae bacterium]
MTWDEKCHEGARLFEAGEHSAALAIFETLAADETVAQFSRAMMYINVATVEDKRGSSIRAAKAYDKAAGLALHSYLYVQLNRMNWLQQKGKPADGVKLAEQLLEIPNLSAEDRKMVEQHLRSCKDAMR